MNGSYKGLRIPNQDQRFEEKDRMNSSMTTRGVCGFRFAAFSKAAMCVLVMGGLALSGCGFSSSVKPTVGPIAFTDFGGTQTSQTASLNTGQGVYVMVNLTNDNALLGADWSVGCASALPPGTPLPAGQTEDLSCGSFTPGHTMSGPIPSYATTSTGYLAFYTAPAAVPKGGTVTLYASATADNTRFSTVTLNILP